MAAPPHDPLAGIEALIADLETELAAEPVRPILTTATSNGAAVTLDAWGVLRDVEVTDTLADGHTLTGELARLVEVAGQALVEPLMPDPPGIVVSAVFSPERPHPGMQERLWGRDGDVEVNPERFEQAASSILGNSRSGGVAVSTYPGGSIRTITVSTVDDQTGSNAMAAAALAAADGVRQAQALVEEGRLPASSAWTRYLLDDPYDHTTKGPDHD